MSQQPEVAALEKREDLLRDMLAARLAPQQLAWLDEQMERLASVSDGNTLSLAIGQASRRLGKHLLQPDAAEVVRAAQVRSGLDIGAWSVDQAARVLLILASFDAAPDRFVERIERLYRSGEIGEQIALLRGLPLYPEPEKLLAVAGEGIRSAMQPIFEAVAHDSPYPAEHFPEAMWNQMVVKALFIGSRLAPIQALDARRNADLARMLVDYARERRAAGRDVSPELWRCVGPFAESYMDDLLRVFESSSRAERQAAGLALAECPHPDAIVILDSDPAMWREIRSGRLTWASIN